MECVCIILDLHMKPDYHVLPNTSMQKSDADSNSVHSFLIKFHLIYIVNDMIRKTMVIIQKLKLILTVLEI